jgi:hypothetical protein
VLLTLFKIVRKLASDLRDQCLLYILCSFNESHAAHHVVSIFHTEDLSDLFRDGDASTRDYFGEEWNVFFLDLDWQLCASGKWLRTR